MFWFLLWCFYVFYKNKHERILEDEAFRNWKPEICDVYYHESKTKHNYYTRSKAIK